MRDAILKYDDFKAKYTNLRRMFYLFTLTGI